MNKKKQIRAWNAAALQRVGEDLDVGFYSNTKVSLTFPALRWLLILVAFPRAAYGTAWPVDIYKVICLRAMAFYKEKHLHMSQKSTVSMAHEHIIALNKHQSTFQRKSHVVSLLLSLPFKVWNYCVFWKLGKLCSRGARQLVGLLHWPTDWWGFVITDSAATAAARGSPLLPCDQVKVCPRHADKVLDGSQD